METRPKKSPLRAYIGRALSGWCALGHVIIVRNACAARSFQGSPLIIVTGELEAWHKSQKVIQLRVIIFLKRWIDSYHNDFDTPGMEDRLVAFDKSLPSSALTSTSTTNGAAQEDIQLIVLLQRKRHPRASTAAPSLPIFPQPWFPPGNTDSLEIADVQALEMARQISLIQSTLFSAIKAREYLQYCVEVCC